MNFLDKQIIYVIRNYFSIMPTWRSEGCHAIQLAKRLVKAV